MRRSHAFRRLSLESLESRRVLTTVVDTLVDEADGSIADGDVSLRDAIAWGDDEITFAPHLDGGTVQLTLGELPVNRLLSIDASALTSGLTVHAAPNADTMHVTARDVAIAGLTLTGATKDSFQSGIGLRISGGSVSLSNCVLTGNDVGAYVNEGTLSVVACNISKNHNMGISGFGREFTLDEPAAAANISINASTIAENGQPNLPGGWGNGGVVQGSVGGLSIHNSTISGNYGVGVSFVTGSEYSSSSVTINSSTISGNDIGFSADADDDSNFGVRIISTTITQNVNGGVDLGEYVRFEAYSSIIADNGSSSVNVPNEIDHSFNFVAGDPRLEPLADNGGPTKTHLPKFDSPVIDSVEPTFLSDMSLLSNRSRDQRGLSRVQGSGVDIGSIERQTEFVVDTLVDEDDGDRTLGDFSLREALRLSHENSTILFDPSLSGGTIRLTMGELSVAKSIVIDASSLPDGLTIDASGNDASPELLGTGSRVFKIDDGIDSIRKEVTLNRLNLTGGDVATDGGAVFSTESLTITNSTIFENSARFGGGIYSRNANLKINTSTLSGNSADHGGGMATNSGTVSLTSSTVTSNTGLIGGGLYVADGTNLSLRSTIVAGNQAIDRSPDLANADVSSVATFSLIGNNAGSGFHESPFGMPDPNGNFIGDPNGHGVIDPRLEPLSKNSGTLVHLPSTVSPAFGRGDPQLGKSLDQRGEPFVRSSFLPVDIGAVEANIAVVDNLADESDDDFSFGDVSLREVIENAGSGTEVIFHQSLDGGEIRLALGELEVSDAIVINASMLPHGLTINASGNDPTPSENLGDGSRIFSAHCGLAIPGGDLTIVGLTLIGGDAPSDGGAICARSNVTIRDSVIQDNFALRHGGGIFSMSNLNLSRVTIAGNAAQDGGGVYSLNWKLEEAVNIVSSTVARNTATGDGGGIFLNASNASIRLSTVSGNSAQNGGGVFGRVASVESTTITDNRAHGEGGGLNLGRHFRSALIVNSIIAGNQGQASPDIHFGANLNLEHSLVGDNSGSDINAAALHEPDENGNFVGDPSAFGVIAPLLSPLGKHGGRTETHALLSGSPAINAGRQVEIDSHDQRGHRFDRDSDGQVDIGAYESQNAPVDFDADGLLGCSDIDAIADAIFASENHSDFDLNDDEIVDEADIDVWLAIAGFSTSNSYRPISRADLNLDGFVNAADLNMIGMHWTKKKVGWCGGDLNFDGQVNSKDINLLALNWLDGTSNRQTPKRTHSQLRVRRGESVE